MFIKKLLLVIFLLTGIATTNMAQNKKMITLQIGKKVEAFEKKGLTKSALQEVLVIYNLAVKDGNDAQQIKSCVYQIKYHNMVDEDSHENNIFFVDTLIAKAKAPAKNILQSMQARKSFWRYLQKQTAGNFMTAPNLPKKKVKTLPPGALINYTLPFQLYTKLLYKMMPF